MTLKENSKKCTAITIFFDVGGVLLDDFIDAKVVDLALKYGQEPAEFLKLRKKIRPLADAGIISDREFWRRLLQEIGVQAAEEDYEVDRYMRPLADGMDLVKKIKASGYKIAILSNDSKEIFLQKRERYGFDELFDDVIVSNEHGCIKPFAEIYQIALKRLSVEPPNAIFIDDRTENLTPAQELGMHTILHQNAQQTEQALIKLGLKFIG